MSRSPSQSSPTLRFHRIDSISPPPNTLSRRVMSLIVLAFHIFETRECVWWRRGESNSRVRVNLAVFLNDTVCIIAGIQSLSTPWDTFSFNFLSRSQYSILLWCSSILCLIYFFNSGLPMIITCVGSVRNTRILPSNSLWSLMVYLLTSILSLPSAVVLHNKCQVPMPLQVTTLRSHPCSFPNCSSCRLQYILHKLQQRHGAMLFA